MSTNAHTLPTKSHEDSIDRRSALAAMGAFGLAATGACASAQNGATGAGRGAAALTAKELGWDARSGEYVLPKLPYRYDALEPHIDEQTMRLHHDIHHAGYVRGLNKALSMLKDIRSSGDTGLIKHWSRELAFHGSGHANHTLFWNIMAPPNDGGGGQPSGDLARRINRDFGSFDQFKAHFSAASGAVEGSGWGLLVYDHAADKLLVMQAEKHQNLTMWGVTPILAIDVWEHAYYLKYQNKRGAYVDAFFNVINWPMVDRMLQRAAG